MTEPAPAPAMEPPALHAFARRVLVSPGQLSLQGDVRLDLHPAYLRSELLLARRRGPRVVDLDGSFVLQPCPCKEAPLALEMRGATLELEQGEPSVVTAREVSLRIAGWRLGPLPWFQVRSPRRWGLVAPRAALRGADGWLVGVGAHAPLGHGGLTLEPGVYLKGGMEWLASARPSEEGSLRLRWDQRGGTLLALEGQGRAALGGGALLWATDLSRGARGRSGVIDLEASARLNDQLKVAWLHEAAGTLGVGVRGLGLRGQEPAWLGPQASWSASTASGTLALSVDGWTAASTEGAVRSLGRTELRASRALWWGALRVRPEALGVGWFGSGGEPVGALAEVSGRGLLALDVPLIRRSQGVLWRLDPGVNAGIIGGQRPAGGGPWGGLPGFEPGAFWGAGTIRNFWTWGGGRAEASAELLAVGRPGEGARLVVHGVGEGQAGAWRGWIEGAEGGRGRWGRAGFLLGEPRGWQGGAGVHGQQDSAPREARWTGEQPWLGPWLERPGWSVEAQGQAPLGASLRTAWRGWLDLSGGRWLGHRMDIIYEHRCGCLRLGLHAGRRAGRDGVDLWGSLTLG
ncbi:MAG: hypothetical protein MUF64_02650 [Polyangiaceae bacterium]|nr:hypothetical protein [Polyangiaceae bacterium]